ncbi:MAG: hypothetical protein JRI45_06615 [Deltaproteobacteria bacterium]|nr:hypothetical protein [Deltaproteobacteria bacterium]
MALKRVINEANIDDFIKDKEDQQKWRRLTELEDRMMRKARGVPRSFTALKIYRKYYERKYGKKKK